MATPSTEKKIDAIPESDVVPSRTGIVGRVANLKDALLHRLRTLTRPYAGQQQREPNMLQSPGFEPLGERYMMSGSVSSPDTPDHIDDVAAFEVHIETLMQEIVEADPTQKPLLEFLEAEGQGLLNIMSLEELSKAIDSASWHLSSDIAGSLAERIHPGTGNAYQSTIDRQGKWMYTSAGKGPVQKIDAATGALKEVQFLGHTGLVTQVAVSADGTMIATGSHDKTVRVYNAETGAMVGSFSPGNLVSSVTFLEDGRIAALGMGIGYCIYNVSTGEKTNATVPVSSMTLAVSPDMTTLVYTKNNALTIVDLATNTKKDVALNLLEGRVSISGDSTRAFVTSWHGTLTCVNLKTGTVEYTIEGPGNATDIAVSGDIVTVAYANGTVRVYESNATSFAVQKEYKLGRAVMDVSVAGASIVALPASDGTGGGRIARFEGIDTEISQLREQKTEAEARLLEIESELRQLKEEIVAPENPVIGPVVSSPLEMLEQSVIEMQDRMNALNAETSPTLEQLQEMRKLQRIVGAHEWSTASDLEVYANPALAMSQEDSRWSPNGKSDRRHALGQHRADIERMSDLLRGAMDRTEILILQSGNTNEELSALKEKFIDVQNALDRKMREFEEDLEEFNSHPWGQFSEKTLATLFPGEQPEALVDPIPLPVDGATWKLTNDIAHAIAERVHPGTGSAYQSTIDRQGKWIYTSAGSGPVQKIDAATGALEDVQFLGHTALVTQVAVSADGAMIATGSYDKTVRIYNTETGAMVGSFSPGNLVSSIQFLEDGRIAALGMGMYYAIYDPVSNTKVSTKVPESAFSLAVSPDMTTLTYVKDNALTIVDLATNAKRDVPLGLAEGRVAISGDGTRAFVVSSNATLYCVDLKTGTVLYSNQGTGTSTDIAVSGNFVSVASSNGLVRVLEATDTGFKLWKEYSTGRAVYDVSMAGGKIVALCARDDTGNSRIAVFDGVDQGPESVEIYNREFSVVEIKGATVSIAVEGAQAGDELVLDEEGILSRFTLQPAEDGGTTYASVVMNTYRKTGIYTLKLRNAVGTSAQTIDFLWNKEEGTLTMKNDADRFQPFAGITDDGSMSYEELINVTRTAEQASLSDAVDQSIALLMTNGMRSLVTGTSALDTPDSKLFYFNQKRHIAEMLEDATGMTLLAMRDYAKTFYHAFPEWKEENRLATMAAKGLSQDAFYHHRQAEWSHYGQIAEGIEKRMIDIIDTAVRITLKMRAGVDTDQDIWHLNNSIGDIIRDSSWMKKALPNSTELIQGINKLLTMEGRELVTYAHISSQRAVNLDWAFNQPNVLDLKQATTEAAQNNSAYEYIFGVGGASKPFEAKDENIFDPASREYLAYRAMHLYDTSKAVPSFISKDEVQTLELTAVGRLFLGTVQKASELLNDIQINDLADMISAATGIDKNKVLLSLPSTTNPSIRVSLLRQLFHPDSSTVGDPTLRAAFHAQPNYGTAMTSATANLLNANTVRIRFNYATPNFSYAIGNVYLLNAQGEQISSTPLVSGGFQDTVYIDMPLTRIAGILNTTYGGPVPRIDVRFKVALWQKLGDTAGLQGVNTTALVSLDLRTVGEDVSANGETHDKAVENYIVSHSVFPLENPTSWHQTFGSGYHRNENFNAFDLNMNIDDGGQPIHAMAAGTVVDIGWYADGTKASHIDIQSEADVIINGKAEHIVWVTRYLHMPMTYSINDKGESVYTMQHNEGVATLKKGDMISQNQVIAGVGKVGAGSNHLHGDVVFLKENQEKISVDFNASFRELGVKSKAVISGQVASEQLLDWDNEAQEWKYDPLKLYYHRNLDGSIHYLAMTDKKEEVFWSNNKAAWIKLGDDNPTVKWEAGSWVPL